MIPDVTLETLCRTFFKEANRYGFQQLDYVRYVNLLLDLAMGSERASAPAREVDRESAPGTVTMLETLNLPVSGENVRIRAFDAATDSTVLDGWLHDDHGKNFLLSRTTSAYLSVEDVINQPTNILGMITLKAGPPIGAVAFLDRDTGQGKAELRKLIGDPRMRGKGYAKEASALWLRYGLGVLGLRKIYLNTLGTNLRNIRINEELGFKIEGILRNEVHFDGRYHDVLRMALWHD